MGHANNDSTVQAAASQLLATSFARLETRIRSRKDASGPATDGSAAGKTTIHSWMMVTDAGSKGLSALAA